MAKDGDEHILHDCKHGKLFDGSDGNGRPAKVLFAVVDNHPALVAADFLIF